MRINAFFMLLHRVKEFLSAKELNCPGVASFCTVYWYQFKSGPKKMRYLCIIQKCIIKKWIIPDAGSDIAGRYPFCCGLKKVL